STMETGVEMRLDLVLGAANDDEAVGPDVVHIIVADLRDLVFAAGHLPGAGPQLLELALRELGIDVAILGDILAAEIFVMLAPRPFGGRRLVARDDVLRALRGAAR